MMRKDNSLKQAIAAGAAPTLVIQDKRSKMIHADYVRCKGIEDEVPN